MTSLVTDSARILDIDTEISQFERPVAQPRLEKVYPVLSLPNEIVSEIFIHFLPAYPNRPPLTGLRSPTLLTHICSKWRYIALTNPELWRAFKLPCLAENWLLRTGGCPLSVEIDESEADLTTQEHSYLFMASRREHWEYLEFKAPRVNLALFDGSLPLLRFLRLDLSLYSANITLHRVPRLRSVALAGLATARATLPWAQLTSLALERVLPAESEDPPVVLPHLHSLALNGMGTFRFWENSIIEQFILPSLCRFEALDRALGKHPLAALSSLIFQSACTLKELCITYDGHPVIELSEYRLAFPSLPQMTSRPRNRKRHDSTYVVDDEDCNVHASAVYVQRVLPSFWKKLTRLLVPLASEYIITTDPGSYVRALAATDPAQRGHLWHLSSYCALPVLSRPPDLPYRLTLRSPFPAPG
ncbi:hypothetical protein R3P38DRAFT_3295841 [Favolaschia claudopus]|uniref:F-box domain-containing protein n=1 Tax=Favolaschia claudopus TaxID=2862362 RepID=A0AAV9Z9S9_9AGAR